MIVMYSAVLSRVESDMNIDKILGPVVQSIVSLTSSLRVISLTVLADSIYNILIFFAEKNVSSFIFFILFIQCLKRVTQLAILASLPCGPLQKLKVQIISKKKVNSHHTYTYIQYIQ